ncbi:inactive protein tyrosine kinase pTKL-like [Amphiprion ocellaris]|uniref:inactive protein tyrosine kinase pTKL-like n=1 Tax=Amphiprion ocellaris TaxID=80972 RepID=UPI002410BF96|nr:inactive protein tyrosine kinase pTKL-like [Amphiprion ocellaris]
MGQPGGVGRGLMEAIYWHRTASNRRETQLLHCFRRSTTNPFPHAKPAPPPSWSPQLPCLLSSTSSGSSPAPASAPVPARTPTLSTSTSST